MHYRDNRHEIYENLKRLQRLIFEEEPVVRSGTIVNQLRQQINEIYMNSDRYFDATDKESVETVKRIVDNKNYIDFATLEAEMSWLVTVFSPKGGNIKYG